MDLSVSSSTIKLNLPNTFKKNIQIEAERIGISLQDFIRMVLSVYFSKSESLKNISDLVLFERAKKELKTGKYKAVKSKKELEQYLLDK
jgi:hypothetical protein